MGRETGRADGGDETGSPVTGDGAGPTSRRLARVGLLVGGGLLGLAVIIYGMGVLLLHLLVEPTTLARWAEPRMEAALHRPVELDGVRLRIFPHLGAELRGVRISSPPGFEGPPLAEVGAVRMQVALLPLFQRRIRVDELRVQEPVVRLVEDPSGRTNYREPASPSREVSAEDGGAPVEMAVRDVTVRGGSVSWRRDADSLRVQLGGLAVDGTVERSGEGWSGRLRAGAESLIVGSARLDGDEVRLVGPLLETGGRAGADFGWVELEEGSLRIGGASLELTGRLDALSEPVRRVDLALRAEDIDAGALLEAVPESASGRVGGEVQGRIGVDLVVQGPMGRDERPEVRGTVDLASMGLRGTGGEPLVEELGGRLEITPGRIAARDFTGTLLGGPLSVSAAVETDSLRTFDARITARPDIQWLSAVAAIPEEVRLGGRLDVSLELSGAGRRIGATRADGTVEGANLRLEHSAVGVPVTVEEVRLVFEGRRVRWNGAGVSLGGDRLTTTGSLDDPLALLSAPGDGVPRLDADVEGARLDLDAVRPPKGDPEITYGRIAFAHLGGRTIRGRSAGEWAGEKELALPDSLPLAGEIRIRLDTLLSVPYRLTDLRARVALAPTLVEVLESRFLLYGGEVATRLRLGAGASPQPFALQLEAGDVRAADFLAATSPLGRHVTGSLSLELDVAGEVDERMLPLARALAGSGRIRVRDGGLAENPLTGALADVLGIPALAAPSFSAWTAPFQVEASRLRFVEAALSAGRVGEIQYGGTTGLDGTLDLGVRLALPAERLDSLALGRSGVLSAVAGRLGDGTFPVAVGIAVGGTIQSPRIRPRPELATGELRRALEAEAGARTEALRDTARARLQEARDSAAARAEDERRRLEERARQEARDAREDLEGRARNLLRGLVRPRGDTARSDTLAPSAPPDGL